MPELLKIVLHLLTDQSGSSSRNLTPFCFSIWCQHGGHLQKEVKMTSNHCFIWSQTVIKNEKVLRPYLHFHPSCLKYRYITLSFCFSIRFWQPFSRAILNFMVKTVLKHKKYPSIRFLTSELARNDTSFVSMTHLILNITAYVFFNMALVPTFGQPYWISRSRWSET